MNLRLTVAGVEVLENGSETQVELCRHGWSIGRSPSSDWCLPDPEKIISSRHCHIDYRDGDYWLTDTSLNGTFLNGSPTRLEAPHALRDGDEFGVGQYRLRASLEGEDAPRRPDPAGGLGPSPFDAYLASSSTPVAPPPREPEVRRQERGVESYQFTPPPLPRAPPAAPAENIWDRLVAPFAGDRPATPPPPPREPAPAGAAPGKSSGQPLWPAFLHGAGLTAGDVAAEPEAALRTAGDLLRRLAGGLVVMLEARARAKAQLGAQGTLYGAHGNNPLKFVRSAEQALAQLLGDPERGFMPADRAVEDAFKDLQDHQLATLAAMQGALRATLDRFSPQAIRERAAAPGPLASVLPSLREAALWRAYEREFEGVARGSDEAFMDVFAKEFRKAYERAAGRG